MENKKISPDRWQALYGPVPSDFHLLVQQTLKKTREAPAMKRFTLRTVLLVILCLLLLMGIALAATGVFGTVNYLKVYTSPTNGTDIDVQTDLNQTGGDFPDLTVTVRDAVYDGAAAYVTVEYSLKDPDKYALLSLEDTYGWPLRDMRHWPEYSTIPLTDPLTDPREKLVLYDERVKVYGVDALASAIHIYEKDGVVVLIFRIELGDAGLSLLEPGYRTAEGFSWVHSAYHVLDWAPNEKPPAEQGIVRGPATREEWEQILSTARNRLNSSEPLELQLTVPLVEWHGGPKGYYLGRYYCKVGITLDKSVSPAIRICDDPIIQDGITLTDARFTFTNLATYADICCQFPVSISMREGSDGELGSGLLYEWVDDQGNAVAPVMIGRRGTAESATDDNAQTESNRFSAWWPAVEHIPDTITLRAYSEYTDNRLAAFTIPLIPTP